MTLERSSVAYVRAVLKQLDMSPSALAKKAGVASTTLTRALNNPDHKFALSTTTLNKIAEATGISPAPFLRGVDQLELAARAILPGEAFERNRQAPRLIDQKTRLSALTVVIGSVAPGKWQDPALAATEHVWLDLTLTGEKPSNCFACRVEGGGSEPVAKDGEYAVCRRIPKWFYQTNEQDPHDEPLLSGRIVVVETRSPDTFEIELTLRVAKVRDQGIDLLQFGALSRSGKIRVGLNGKDKNIRILGVVEFIVRDPHSYEEREKIFSNLR